MKNLIVREPPERVVQHFISIGDKFADADMIEVRVKLTPLRWVEPRTSEQLEQAGLAIYAEERIVMLEAKDSRYLFHCVRQLIRLLVKEYLNVEI